MNQHQANDYISKPNILKNQNNKQETLIKRTQRARNDPDIFKTVSVKQKLFVYICSFQNNRQL